MTRGKGSTRGMGPGAGKEDEGACKHGLEMRRQKRVPSMLDECKTWVDVVPSGGHGCGPRHTMFWSARPQTAGTEAMIWGEPGMEKGRKSEEIYKLVRATAALSRETDWTLLMDLSSGREI